MKEDSPRSLRMLTLSMLIYGSIGIFRRFIPLPSSVLACYRGFMGALVLLIAAKAQKKPIFRRIGREKVFWLAVSGALIGVNWIALFEAYNHTSVPVATLCYYMEPTIVVLLSPLLFRERISAKKWVCVLLSLLGMVFVSGLAENGIPPVSEIRGILLGLGAALLYACVVILNKKLPGIDAYQKTILQLFAASVTLLPYLLIRRPPITAEWTPTISVMLLIVGIVHTGLAYALYFGSMDGVKAQTVAILSYLDPVTALLLSALILHERLTVYGLIGAVLIIGSALCSEISFKGERS